MNSFQLSFIGVLLCLVGVFVWLGSTEPEQAVEVGAARYSYVHRYVNPCRLDLHLGADNILLVEHAEGIQPASDYLQHWRQSYRAQSCDWAEVQIAAPSNLAVQDVLKFSAELKSVEGVNVAWLKAVDN